MSKAFWISDQNWNSHKCLDIFKNSKISFWLNFWQKCWIPYSTSKLKKDDEQNCENLICFLWKLWNWFCWQLDFPLDFIDKKKLGKLNFVITKLLCIIYVHNLSEFSKMHFFCWLRSPPWQAIKNLLLASFSARSDLQKCMQVWQYFQQLNQTFIQKPFERLLHYENTTERIVVQCLIPNVHTRVCVCSVLLFCFHAC